jgi:hypothetical protein
MISQYRAETQKELEYLNSPEKLVEDLREAINRTQNMDLRQRNGKVLRQ